MVLGDRFDVDAAGSLAVVSFATLPTTILLPLTSIDLGLPSRLPANRVM
jgi:hypothetical protein